MSNLSDPGLDILVDMLIQVKSTQIDHRSINDRRCCIREEIAIVSQQEQIQDRR